MLILLSLYNLKGNHDSDTFPLSSENVSYRNYTVLYLQEASCVENSTALLKYQ